MELSIIMINYNTPELTAQAVESILKTTHQVSYEILVIDNSSERDKEYRPEALPAPVKVFYGIDCMYCGYGFDIWLDVKRPWGFKSIH